MKSFWGGWNDNMRRTDCKSAGGKAAGPGKPFAPGSMLVPYGHIMVPPTCPPELDLPADEFADSHGNSICRVALAPGSNLFRHDAIVAVSSKPDNHGLGAAPLAPGDLPPAMLRYTLPSRYCDSDKLVNFAWEKFGRVEHGWPRVQAISGWIHENIEYRYLSGRS